MNEIQLDIRGGCVAVYRGPILNCLSGISESPRCLFYAHGYWKNDQWHVSRRNIQKARRIYRETSAVTRKEKR